MSYSDLENPYYLASVLGDFAQRYLSTDGLPGQRRRLGFDSNRGQMLLVSKSRYDELRELADVDPLKVPLLRWVHRLTETRVNQLWLDEDERLERSQLHPVRTPVDMTISLADMKKRAMQTPAEVGRAWWEDQRRHGAALVRHRIGYFARCVEFHERLGETDLLRHWSSLDDGAQASQLIEPVRQRLSDFLRECGVQGEVDLLELAAGRSHGEGWPARLAPDSMTRLFSAPEFFRGTQLGAVALPERLSPASFFVAAYRVGRALCRAWAPSDRPLVALRDPDDLMGHRLGIICVLWFGSRAFDHKILGLGRALAERRKRSFAALLLAHFALAALRNDLFEQSLGRRWDDERAEETLGRYFEDVAFPSNAFVSYGIHRDEGARLAAWLDGAHGYVQLVEEFDEDFMLDPRAREKIRAEFAQAADTRVARARAELGRAALFEWLFDGLNSG